MSTFADKLAAALVPLSSETKTALARLLLSQAGFAGPRAVTKTARTSKALLDTRTVAELWLAGEDHTARNRAIAKAESAGEYRSILVTFADGFTVRTGSFMRDDGHAKAAAVRFARAQAMGREFARAARDHRAQCEAIREALIAAGDYDFGDSSPYPKLNEGWRWVTLPDATTRRTRVCAVPDVANVEFVPMAPAVQLVQVGEAFVIADGEFCPVDFIAMKQRAQAAERRAKGGQIKTGLPVPLAFTPPDLAVRTAQAAVEPRRALSAHSAWSIRLKASSALSGQPLPIVPLSELRAA